jgi:hypothetical protein
VGLGGSLTALSWIDGGGLVSNDGGNFVCDGRGPGDALR